MVLGVQTFDHLAEHGGGEDKRILPMPPLFNGIAANPSAPEFWWLYALLLSSMIPSFINLMIGGASFLRGVPGLPSLLLRFMPAGKAVPPFDRQWIALVLTSQVFVGALLGIAAQAFLAVGVIFYILPWIGFGLLDTARDVAAFDLPGNLDENQRRMLGAIAPEARPMAPLMGLVRAVAKPVPSPPGLNIPNAPIGGAGSSVQSW
jgi:hypothetical protein